MKKDFADGLGDLVPRPQVILRKKERKEKSEPVEDSRIEEIKELVSVVKSSDATD